MERYFRVAFALLLFSTSAFAETVGQPNAPNNTAGNQRSLVALVDQSHFLAQIGALAARSAPPKSANGTGPIPVLPIANPGRSYPPSCLAEPLPDVPSGPTYTNPNVTLTAANAITGAFTLETVSITIWRVACSSSQFYTSATLMRIQRQSAFEGDSLIYPLFPLIRYSQGSVTFDDASQPQNLGRASLLPNTIVAAANPNTPVVYSTTYVLENFPSVTGGPVNFNLPLGIRIDNSLLEGTRYFYINVPAYVPTQGTYPAAFQGLPISGYLGTNWYDPTADGEGIVLQIYERPNEFDTLVVSFSWSAFDSGGIPFWLFGQADIARGARSVTSPMGYRTGGGFGGNAGASDPPVLWGTATVSFPDCNHMTLTYASNPGLPSFVPQGSGTRTWTRVANVNALPCE